MASVASSKFCVKSSLGDASFPWPDGSPARRAASLCICPRAGLGRTSSVAPWHDSARCLSRPDGAHPPLTQLPRQLAPGPVRECFLPCPIPPSRSPQPSQAAISTPNSAQPQFTLNSPTSSPAPPKCRKSSYIPRFRPQSRSGSRRWRLGVPLLDPSQGFSKTTRAPTLLRDPPVYPAVAAGRRVGTRLTAIGPPAAVASALGEVGLL